MRNFLPIEGSSSLQQPSQEDLRRNAVDARIEIFRASEVVSMKESAAKAVRHKKDASICRAVDLVKNGSAHAVVSAGHTGAALGLPVSSNSGR